MKSEVKGVRKLKKEKLEQLRTVFKAILEHYLNINEEWKINNLIDELLYEVKIRCFNKIN